ncbi:hypothetical protein [Labrys wisconsinensis]|uniref:Uncharacterized protein n=1 Tax=Labrys wisconsinensis TaxID=425677 RepID=A0ABU0IZT1_9HYPH|nr:hypothetical protein [Labrys wisconsinensis]MDQ0467526.1 hypothetical protein [Labrys wisconsinensis]
MMTSSPITSWDGATAYFTFADRPAVLALICLAAAAVCVYAIASMVRHETERYAEIGRQ